MDATVLDEIRRIKPLIKETEARTLLGRFLFSGDDVLQARRRSFRRRAQPGGAGAAHA